MGSLANKQSENLTSSVFGPPRQSCKFPAQVIDKLGFLCSPIFISPVGISRKSYCTTPDIGVGISGSRIGVSKVLHWSFLCDGQGALGKLSCTQTISLQ